MIFKYQTVYLGPLCCQIVRFVNHFDPRSAYSVTAPRCCCTIQKREKKKKKLFFCCWKANISQPIVNHTWLDVIFRWLKKLKIFFLTSALLWNSNRVCVCVCVSNQGFSFYDSLSPFGFNCGLLIKIMEFKERHVNGYVISTIIKNSSFLIKLLSYSQNCGDMFFSS